MDQTPKNKKIGVGIMVLGALCSFTSLIYFNQAGTSIEYTNTIYMLKLIATQAFLPLGLYFGLYFYSSKKLALQIGGGMALLLVIANLLGFLLHH